MDPPTSGTFSTTFPTMQAASGPEATVTVSTLLLMLVTILPWIRRTLRKAKTR